MSGADDQRAARDQVYRDEQDRNRRLADRIATSGAPLDDEMIATMRQMAGANLNVPGPRVVQLLAEFDRLRAELAETRDRRDYLQGQLDLIYDAEYSRNDALKRRIEKMGTAGDALADATNALLDQWRWLNERSRPDGASTCETRLVEWRSVRGDAPTQPPADAWVSGSSGEPYGPGTVVDVIADEINTTFGMDLSWPKISGTAHRAAARLRREGHLDGDAHPLATRPTFADYTAPDDEADTLTAEQYRHIYTDLIHGLATDLGLDPDKAGGGSITAAVRRLVAGVSVPQKSTESPAGARCEHGVPVTRWCAGCTLTEQPADGDTAAPDESIDELRQELALRRSGIATAPPCTDGYWRNEIHPPPPSATSGENADPREVT